MKKSHLLLIIILFLSLEEGYSQIAAKASDASPLMNGEVIPPVTLLDLDAQSVDLQSLISEKPTLLLFYRGSWCPYCNVQLAGIQNIFDQLNTLGVQIVAISPDTPENMQMTVDKNKLNYMVLSDSNTEFIQKMGLAFKDKRELTLPVPAIYLVNTDNLVLFNYVNPNYKVRATPELILAAAELLVKE